MDSVIEFDPAYDWADAGGRDPDSHSSRLRDYHRRLWSGRPLRGVSDGRTLQLEPKWDGLVDTGLGRLFFDTRVPLFLKSDAAIPDWARWRETRQLRSEDPGLLADVKAAYWPLYNMGGMILFPGEAINRAWTINQAKGCLRRIADRLDLTIECVRLHYEGVHDARRNPLGPTLARYRDFFDLFGDFRGYVDFWLLQDLVTADCPAVDFFMEGELAEWDFAARSPFPASAEEYRRYLRRAQEFVARRNERMTSEWARISKAQPPG